MQKNCADIFLRI